MTQTILLLGSDPGIRNVLARALEAEGCCVLTAGDVGVAEDLLRKYSFDLLIVRPYLESISGHDAAIYLRRRAPGLPVLIVSGLLQDLNLETREAVQEFEIFPKPFSSADLLAKVREVLARSAAALQRNGQKL
jgi:DNA-binding response OmpR family regulator